ncbi:MAG: tetratricopeptide repeat protein, partial [Anaerolineales bacterium]|nr:tetratricopeptide repeat protein [Anaerolineales bacterium]
MAEIGLRTYLHQIDGLIEQKQLDEAVAHCKHLLTHFPKCLEAYRLLGKSLLEKSRHGDAADIFQRVLSAVPDDFVAHVGMSLVREDEANLEAALWHMERAFESNPANTAIQEELRRLYGRRDGVMPARARLTRGALARMYARGELYPQAEAELRAALDEDPERLDLLTLLAGVLFETNRRAEATELVNHVLHKLPYSQAGNRLLGEILHAQNRPEDAKACRQRLEALDPYEAFADGHGVEHVRDDAVRVPEPTETPEQAAAASAAPDWAASLGETEAFAAPLAADTGDEPDWLKTGTGLLTAQPAALTGATDLPAAGEVPDWLKDVEPAAAAPAPELPDWMKATTGMLTDTSESGEPGKKKKTGSLSEWLKPEESAGALAEAEVPDWMKDLAPPASATAEEPTRRLDELPEWMRAEPEQPAGNATPWLTGKLTPPGEAEAAPDWGQPAGDETRALDDQAAAELPEWMRASAGETTDLKPAWLSETPAPPAEVGGVTGPLDEGALDELPAWMRAAGEPSLPAAAEPAEALPDWLQAAAGSPAAAAAEPAEDLPDWLKAVSGPAAAEPAPAEPAAAPSVELPDFLQPASPEAIARANAAVEWEEAAPPAPSESAEAGAMPDWLKALAPDLSAPPPAIPEEDLPPVAADDLPE